jgi:hypothetical protein
MWYVVVIGPLTFTFEISRTSRFLRNQDGEPLHGEIPWPSYECVWLVRSQSLETEFMVGGEVDQDLLGTSPTRYMPYLSARHPFRRRFAIRPETPDMP